MIQIAKDLIDLFPNVLDKDESSTLYKYLDEHRTELNSIEQKINQARDSRYVQHAEGQTLERVGAIFGILGQRSGRPDDEYRVYLQSIINSFSGRGTKPGIKFAVASSLNIDTSDVTIREIFDEVAIEVQIDADSSLQFSTVNDIIDLAKASCVDIASKPVLTLDGITISINITESNIVSTEQGLCSDTLTLDGKSQLS